MEELITVKKALEKLSEKTNMYHTEAKESIDNLNRKIENTERQNNFPARNTGTHSSPPHTTLRQNDRMKTTKKSVFLSKTKIMYVGDSIGHNVNFANVEQATKTRIRTQKAFGS